MNSSIISQSQPLGSCRAGKTLSSQCTGRLKSEAHLAATFEVAMHGTGCSQQDG